MKCYKVLFSIKGIIVNIAFYSTLLIIIFHIITVIIFYKKQKKIIIKDIDDIKYALGNLDLIKGEERKENKNKKKTRNKKGKKNLLDIKNDKEVKKNETKGKRIKRKNPNNYYFYDNILNKPKPNPSKKKSQKKYNKENNFMKTKNKKKSFIKTPNKNIDKNAVIKKSKKILKYNDSEKNNLEYDLAIKYDKRTFRQYYISLLKTKHPFIFSFFKCYKDYNSRIIKIDLFFINFIINFTVNSLFFNDDTMHKIYVDEGDFNFIYQLPQIIYSSLISAVLTFLLKYLSLSEDNIIDYKNEKSQNKLKLRTKKLKSKLTIKFILFFIFGFIFLLGFWYYLSMFCAIYSKTQFHLIKDTLISFGSSLIYPFGIYLLPGLFRIPALSNPKNNRKCLYNFSKILQIL